eukprot:TRINITY_DN26408_c1_g1_i2.p1 TRINITY_DN26408_c1_g1~~TRINITY_DN26408_c1_g1_i2.p1  ORF type:complete len:168 (+),score=32.03 TRINITY_DN26408_c1_g1_i2:229-732(+)
MVAFSSSVSAGTNEAPAPAKVVVERLFLKIDRALVEQLAEINPPAAGLMYGLAQMSQQPEPGAASEGDSGSPIVLSRDSVYEIMSADADVDTVIRLGKTLGEGQYSSVTFKLIKLPEGKGVMRYAHSVRNEAGELVQRLYPDVDLNLSWVKTGRAGYWNAVGWILAD